MRRGGWQRRRLPRWGGERQARESRDMVPCAPLEDVEEPEPRRKMELYVSGGEVSAGRGGGSPRAPACLCPAAWEPPGRGWEEEVEEGVEEEEKEEEESGRSAAHLRSQYPLSPPRTRHGPAASSAGARGRRHFLAARTVPGAGCWAGKVMTKLRSPGAECWGGTRVGLRWEPACCASP